MTYSFIFIIISLIIITIYTKINNKSISKKKLLLLLTSLSIIPLTTQALCTVNINIEANIKIENKQAIFLPGTEVNIKMKELAGDNTSVEIDRQNFKDTNIISIKYFEAAPIDSNREEKNIVSTIDSPYPIYMWYENNTIYWWSEDIHPSLNEDASNMCVYLTNLENIIGLKDIDVKNTIRLNAFFHFANLKDLQYLEKWDTSNAKYFQNFLSFNMNLENMDGIKYWDVTSARNFIDCFMSCFSLEEIDLSNWQTTDELKNLYGMFGMSQPNGKVSLEGSLKRIKLSDKFNTSNVVNMESFLTNNDELEDYSFLQYINTSKVTTLRSAFQNNYLFDDEAFQYIKNWDTSSVTDISYLFFNNRSLTSLSGLENWDVSNVKAFNTTFYGCSSIVKLDLNKWNTSKATNMKNMFANLSSLEELDISSFDTRNVTSFSFMFAGSNNIKVINVGENWNTDSNTDDSNNVFPSSCQLRNFSSNNPNYRNLSYAHYGEGGYLTLKTE